MNLATSNSKFAMKSRSNITLIEPVGAPGGSESAFKCLKCAQWHKPDENADLADSGVRWQQLYAEKVL